MYSGHYCFAVNGHEHGFFHNVEWIIYSKWVEFLLHKRCRPPRGFIYLKADPNVCMERVKKRGRASEKSLALDYMQQIHTRHEKFLVEKEGVFENISNVPVLILDCNEGFEANKDVMDGHIEKIKTFLLEKA